MSDYKFKVGDKVKILKMDEWSNEDMVYDIGRIGIIVDRDDDEGVNGYLVDLEDKYIDGLWYMENSLELVSENKLTFNRTNVLDIIYTELYKDASTETYNALLNILNNIERLKCK
jgi:hypothetical protein